MNQKTEHSISSIWLFWLPVALFAGLLVLYALMPVFYGQWIDGESGVLECLHTFFIFLAFIIALRLLKRIYKQDDRFLTGWVGIAAFACLYVFLEEISYGQHFMGWEAGEFWSEINDQQETNLHNTSSWFDQKPRLILLIGVIFGGMVMPLLQKYKPGLLPEKYALIYPSGALFCIALLALLANISDDIHKLGEGIPRPFGRASELEETYLYYFVLLYLIMLRQKIKPASGGSDLFEQGK